MSKQTRTTMAVAAALMATLAPVWAAGSRAKTHHDHSDHADTYTADTTHADVGFKIAHMVISKVRGSFTEFDATLKVAHGQLVSANATIKTASINTNNKKRDDHLRGKDFFESEKYPEITFKSTAATKKGGKDVLVGDLTIHGVTKSVALGYSLKGPVTDPWGNTKVGLEASGTINRQDFGLTWSKALETGGLVVGDDVELTIDIEAAKK